MASRMMTYPKTRTRLSTWPPSSMEWNRAGSPSATMHTPTIWTIVTTRNTQSSVSKAEANQEKLIQAQMIAKTPMEKAMSPVHV